MADQLTGEPSQPCDGRRARGERSRAAILERAAAIASTEGLDGLTIGRLAADVGVGKGNIQVLFGDKESLQLATIDWAAALHRSAIVEPALRETSPVARLAAMIDRWFDFVDQRVLPGGCFMNAVSSEFRARPGAIRDSVAQRRAEKRDRYLQTVREAKAAEELRAEIDEEQLAFELLAFQAAANIAATIGDDADFARARTTSHARLAAART